MNILRFKKAVSTAVMLSFTTLSSLAPVAKVIAAPICSTSDYTTATGSNPACATVSFPTGLYAYPKLAWAPVGTLSYSPNTGVNLKIGDRVTSDNNRTAGALGLSADKVPSVVNLLPSSVPFVFARFDPGNAILNIDIFKVERTGGQTQLMHTTFAPAHGGAWAASLAYSSPSDQQARLGPGRNPFAQFEGGDDAFHHMLGYNAVQAAVGHAMRASHAAIGLVAIADVRVDQYTTKSGGWFKKTITQHVDGYTKPKWFVATPQVLQSDGVTLQPMCMDNVSDPSTCPAGSAVASGIVWNEWTGGSLPAFESLTSSWSQSKSGFTLLAWVAVAFIAFFTAGAALAAAGVATSTIGPMTAIVNALAPAGAAAASAEVGLGALAAAAGMEAGLVATAGAVQGAGATSVVNGPYGGATSGFGDPTAPTSPAETSIRAGVTAKFNTADVNAVGVAAVRQAAFGTGCPEGLPSSACASSGVVPRTDTYDDTNTLKAWTDNGAPLKANSTLMH